MNQRLCFRTGSTDDKVLCPEYEKGSELERPCCAGQNLGRWVKKRRGGWRVAVAKVAVVHFSYGRGSTTREDRWGPERGARSLVSAIRGTRLTAAVRQKGGGWGGAVSYVKYGPWKGRFELDPPPRWHQRMGALSVDSLLPRRQPPAF